MIETVGISKHIVHSTYHQYKGIFWGKCLAVIKEPEAE